jgi:hypothetical protein
VCGFSGLNDAFAARLNAASSALQWHTFLGGAGDDYGCGLALDGSGNFYLAGTSLAIWGSPLRSHAGLFDAFVARLDSSGALLWNTFLGGAGIDTSGGIGVDGSANAYLIGSSTDAWGASPVSVYLAGWDAFAVELDPSGALQWQTFLGGDEQDQGYGIAVSADGSQIYTAGGSAGAWGAPLLAYSAWWDGFAALLNGSGARQWNTFLGSGWSDTARSVALDSSGNAYVLGDGDDDWGAPAQPYTWGYDAYLVKLDAAGAVQQHTFLGGWGDDFGSGLAVGAGGSLLLAGASDQAWGSPVQSFEDGTDVFAAQLDNAGVVQWTTLLNGDPWLTSLPLVER